MPRDVNDVFRSKYCISSVSVLRSHVMVQAVSRRPLVAETRVRFGVIPCEICDVQSINGTGFSPGTSIYSFHYHSTNAPYSSINLTPTLYNLSN